MTDSVILAFISRKWKVFLSCFQNTVSCHIMREVYRGIGGAWTNSVFVSAFCRDSGCDSRASGGIVQKIFYLPFAFLGLFAGRTGVRVCGWFKSTLLYRVLYCIVNNLVALQTRFLGVLLLTGGGVYLIYGKSYTDIIPLAVCATGIILCLFNFSILNALRFSVINWLFKTFLSHEPAFDYFDEAETEKRGRLWIAAAAGALCGFVAAHFSVIIALGLVGALIFLFKTEFAVGATVFAIPFIPTMAAAGLVVLCFVSLVLQKTAQGDKIWKCGVMGALILCFMLIVLVCSIASASVGSSLQICFLYVVFLSFYFTVINAVKTKDQLYATLLGFMLSGLLVAAYGIIQYAFGLDMDKQVWIDEAMFSDIKMRAFSTLENPNVLGEYLLLIIPVAVAFMWFKKGVWPKIAYAGITGVLLLCLVLTMSRGCWVGLLIAMAIYITFVDGRYWLLGLIGLALLPSFIPESILNRFLSIGNLNDTSSSYRMFIWLGTVAMLKDYWIAGIGPGRIAFNLVYPQYAYQGIIAPHAHNVYLQMTAETGIAGIACFLLICIVFFRRIASAARALEKKSSDRIMGIALASGVAAFLVQGAFDYVFYNYRVFLMFWMVLALGIVLRDISCRKEQADD